MTQTSWPTISDALRVVQSYARTRVKVATLGGDGNDTPFEQAFSNLAHAYLRDKAPSLLDHEQGFQLLDRNEDNTKAVGVFGFKVGSHQLFAPMFFLNGELKGHELLYLKNQDLFIPLKENWLNYLLNRKPHILGAGVNRNLSRLGALQPDLNRLSQSPYKYASAVSPAIREFMPKYAWLTLPETMAREMRDFSQFCQERLDLGHFIKQASLPTLEYLVSMCTQYPAVGAAVDRWHGLDCIRDAVKTAGLRARGVTSVLDGPPPRPIVRTGICTGSILEKRADDDAKQKVKVIYYDAQRTEPPEGLDEEDAEKLLKETVLVKDERKGEQVSVPYNVQVEKKLFNPAETGLYMVLVKPGAFERCFICINPHGANGRASFATLIRVDQDKPAWCNAETAAIWAAARIEDEEYKEWYDGLSDADSLSSGKDRCVLVGPRGNATLPFRVDEEYGSGEGEKIYKVNFSTYCDHTARHAARFGRRRYECSSFDEYDDYSPWRDGERLHLDGKIGTDLRSSRGDLWVPKGYKKLMVEKTKADKERDDDTVSCAPCSPGGDSRSENPPLIPGNLLDAELAVMTKTSSLKILHDGSELYINDQAPRMPLDAMVHLVVDHGLREGVARHIIKQAAAKRASGGGALQLRIKYAEPYLTDAGPTAPAIPEPPMGGYNFMGYGGQTQMPQEQMLPVGQMSASMTDPNTYNVNPANTPDPMDMQNIQSAVESGQKEVFDTAMIGSMLKTVRDDSMVDRYLPDIIKGMDRLGRILFMFYWHGDKFADRYGKQDLPELEDSLRNAFEQMGDVAIFLKQKTIEADPQMANMDIDLGETSQE